MTSPFPDRSLSGRWQRLFCRPVPACAAIMAVALLSSGLLNAAPATYDWSGVTSVNMNVASNWGGIVPTGTDVGRWNAATYANAPTANTNLTFGEFLFASGNTGGVTFGVNANTITLNGVGGVGIEVDAGSGAVSTGGAKFALGAAQSWTNNSSNSLTVAGTINNGGFLLTLDGSGATALNGIISGAGGVSVSNGAVTLGAANTYTGAVNLSSGTLILGNNASLGAVASSVLTITGGSIDISGANKTTGNAQNWNGDFTYVGASGFTWTDTGAVTLGGNRTVTVSANTMTVNAAISDGVNSYSLSKNGNGNLILQTANTFDGGVILNAGTLTFNNATALGTGTFTINGGDIEGNAVTIANAQVWNGDFSFGGNVNSLNLGAGAVSLTNNVKLTTALNGVRTLTVGGIISGAHSLTKDGAGQLTLNGASDFSGGLTILNGTVLFNVAGSAPGTGTITLGDTGGSNSVTFNNAANAGTSDPFIIRAGTTGTISILTTANALPVYSGSVALNNDLTVAHAGSNTKTTTFSGLVTEDSIAHTVTLASSNSGAVIFSGGIIIGTGGLTTVVSAGATTGVVVGTGALRITGGITSTTSGNLTLQNNSTLADGITISGSSVNNAGTITNSGAGTGSVTISSAIGSNVTGVIQNSATSFLNLTGSNSYAGTTTISSGTIFLGNANALGTSGLAVNNGTLDLNGKSVTVSGISGSSSGLITTSSNAAITLTSNGAGTYAGSITNGAGTVSFTKSGAGVQTLAGSNSYTGATAVNAGTLMINGSVTSAVTVGNTATLGGTGTVGALTIQSGGVVSPGNSLGTLNSGAFNLNSSGTLAMSLTGNTASPVVGTNYNQISVTGGVTLGGALSLTLNGYTQVNGAIYFLVLNDGADAIGGVFSNATSTDPSTVFTLGGQQWQINYQADSASTTSANFTAALGNDVALMAVASVPEPSTWALLGLSVGTAVLFRRRR